MTKLYVANVTKQEYHFSYRVPERAGFVTQVVPVGGQVLIAPNGTNTDLGQPEIDSILKIGEQYGMVAVDEISSSKAPFHGIAYSLDKPVTVEKLHGAMLKNEDMLEALGKKIRMEAAVAVNNRIEDQLGENLRQLEMSITEEEPRGGYNDDHKPLGEGVRVTREEGGNTLPFVGRRGGRR